MIEGRKTLPGPDFFLLPHPRAPLFSQESPGNSQLILKQVFREVLGGNYPTREAYINLLSQLGLVSLWFFLKIILGFAGPYNELDEDLHREMCNFRQGPWCMLPGSRAAVLLPRGFLKSTIMTHGADHWEITRNPDERICIANATAGKADSFRSNIKTSTEKNALYRECYPWVLPARNAKRWNESELVFGGRTRHFTEPSVYALGVGAAAEGLHFTLFNPDDLAGLDDLDVEHMGNINMMQKVQWFKTNRRALLKSQKTSRIVFPMTRFSLDDPSNLILEDLKEVFGYTLEEFEPKPNGTWTVYNRLGEEDGKMVCPQVLTKKDLENQLEDDYWGAMTQSMNRPAKTGMVEFSDFRVKPASLEWDEEHNEYAIKLGDEDNFDEDGKPKKPRPLSWHDVVMAVDPASTERDIDAKVSRTAIAVWAVDEDENAILIWRRVGYFNPITWFNHLFDGVRKFSGAIRCCVVEAAAMQKVLEPLLRKEAVERRVGIYFKPVPALGNKDGRIRMKFQPLFARGKVYAVSGEDSELKQEVKVFPSSKWRKDLLDASEKALSEAHAPEKQEDIDARSAMEFESNQFVNEITGW